jgi:large subunit ribosomal protein L6e
MYKRRGLWAIKAKNGGKFPVHPKQEKTEAEKVRGPRFYPADDVPQPKKKNVIRRPTKLRASITPGTVLILLAGQFKGKRVVFLKQLSSGLLLVTGPYKLNGVPLRRVNQRYVISTSTKVDISSVDASKFEDAYFAKEEKKAKKGESEFFDENEEKEVVSEEKKEDQKAMDAQLLPVVEGVPYLKEYLKSRFSLKSGDKPHEMAF